LGRIRSIHPELFTDDKFVYCTPYSRLLIIGLWTVADDQGVFQWSPLGLKLKLLGNDDINVEELLKELEEKDFIKKYQVDGKVFGAIRNFRTFQHPQRPTNKYSLPANLHKYVGLTKTTIQENSERCTGGVQEEHRKSTGALTPKGSVVESSVVKRREEKNKTKEYIKAKISFDPQSGKLNNVPELLLIKWKDLYPTINIADEIKKAETWLVVEPTRRKKNYETFLNKWMSNTKTAPTKARPGRTVSSESDIVTFRQREEQREIDHGEETEYDENISYEELVKRDQGIRQKT